jgi:hypothetical protein
MRKARFALAALMALSVVPGYVTAQENAKSESRKPAITLKIQVTFTESQGEKKLANLPYTFFLDAPEPSPAVSWTKVRVGSRVPVATGNDKDSTQFQYIDVGTNIDARGMASADGRFEVQLNLERSWVEGDVLVPTANPTNAPGDANPGQFKEPIIRQFKTNLDLTMHDGQTIQTTQAADPLSGRILTITVVMNIVK